MDNLVSLKGKFKNPPSEYRSVPFWSWNDRLSEEELARQVKDMKEHGMGGFFMHSREGLETVYMGDEWMNCVKETIKAAKENGMGAWIYDEDRWPSGAAGGLVPAKGGDAFRAKVLTIEVAGSEYKDDGKALALFAAVLDNNRIVSLRRLGETQRTPALRDGEVLLVFRREVSGPSEWFNDDAPADNLNPESVKAFIETTYEAYKEKAGDEFGDTVPGIFTDEPNIADSRSVFAGRKGRIPWTDGFQEFFQDKRGYDFLDLVPFVFFEGEKSPKVRHDFWRTISERFCESYSKQLGEWCDNNNLAFTGHYLYENDMGNATRAGGSIMPHYRYQHVPGIDMLCEQTHENLTVKQCTSVANQYGRKRVLSEMYGCTGWDFTFEGQKWIGDWQYVMGVNLRCQHLALYSLKGCRKRDYPPVFNYNTTWWKYNNIVEDYFARLGAVMCQGEAVRDVLVLHPASTGWAMMGADAQIKTEWYADKYVEAVNILSAEYNEFIRHMLGLHYDFDLGDEIIMEEEGKAEDGRIRINRAKYLVVVMPPQVRSVFKSTLKLLKEFMEKGGRIIAIQPLADMVEGEPSNELSDFFKHENMTVIESANDLNDAMEKILMRRVAIRNRYGTQAHELIYMLRDLPDCQVLFVVNNDTDRSYEVGITVACIGDVEEWDPLTGETKRIEVVEEKNGCVTFGAIFGPAGSRLYVINKNREPKITNKVFHTRYINYHKPRKTHAVLGPVCRFTRTAPNALILDKCSYRIEKNSWSDETDVWQAQRKVRDFLGMRQIYYNGLPQRYKWVDIPHPNDGTPVDFKFVFNVEQVPEKEVYFVLENAKNFSITVNGNRISCRPEGWFIDRAFDKIRLPGLKKGLNEIILSCGYSNRMEVEDCYIIGDFGVDINRNIVNEPETLHFGDWCLQGYFHYCGSMVYHFELNFDDSNGKNAIIELGDYSAVLVEIRVNGNTAGHIPWRAANGLDIGKFLKKGANSIDIEVMGSPRNIFGPFHQVEDKNPWTDWSSFRREAEHYTPHYVVKPYGLFGQVHIYAE